MKQSMKPMDEALKTHYSEKSLSDSQLDRLMALQEDVKQDGVTLEHALSPAGIPAHPLEQAQLAEGSTPGQSRLASMRNKLNAFLPDFGRYSYVYYASACLLLTGLILSLSLFNQSSLTERVMDEIAYNHRQEMPVEVAANSMPAIGGYLDRLSFSLISPRALVDSGWQILGGRYCSINGKLAAQLKVRNVAEDKVYTLYQASTEGDLTQTGLSMTSNMVGDVKVSIWQEQGLLLGLASSQ